MAAQVPAPSCGRGSAERIQGSPLPRPETRELSKAPRRNVWSGSSDSLRSRRADGRHLLALVRPGRLVRVPERHDAQHDASRRQVPAGHPLHVCGGHGQKLLVLRAEVASVSVEARAVGQAERFPEVRLQACQKSELFPRRGLLDLFSRRAFRLESAITESAADSRSVRECPGRGVIASPNSPTSSWVDCCATTEAAACWSNTSALVSRAVRGPLRIEASTSSANRSSLRSPTVGHWTYRRGPRPDPRRRGVSPMAVTPARQSDA